MGFLYQDGLADLDTVYSALVTNIGDSFNDPAWEELFTHESGSFEFTTFDGAEETTNPFTVFRSKLVSNTEETNPHEYAILILEKDAALNRLLVRTARSFTSGGVSVGVTSLADVLSANTLLDTVSGDNAVAFHGADYNVTISVRSASGVSAVTLAALHSFPDEIDPNNAYCLLRLGEDVGLFENIVLDCGYPLAQVNTVLHPTGGSPRVAMSEFPLLTSNTFVGFPSKVYKSSNTSPVNYDILNVSGSLYRAFQDSDGFKGVQN